MARTSDPHAASVKSWLTRARSSDVHQQRGDFGADADPARMLLTSRVVKTDALGGGVSATYVVTLDNGRKAKFSIPPASSDSDGYEGAYMDAAAWDVAKLVGMDDMVPPTVVRDLAVPVFGRVEVMRGSLALWQEGETAAKHEMSGSFENHIEKVFDGEEDLQRAAMFDYIIGNADRHEGNWVVDKATGKIRLIDHNISFVENQRDIYSEFLDRIQMKTVVRGREMLLHPLSSQSPARFAEPYRAKKSQILAKLGRSGLSPAKLAAVAERIDHAATVADWADLMGWNDGPGMRDQGS